MSQLFWCNLSDPHACGSGRVRFVPSLAACLLAGFAGGPAAAQELAGDGSIECGSSYVVAIGDTLSRLAERAYGDPRLYGLIAEANQEALAGDPENIAVGTVLLLPCVDASGRLEGSEQATGTSAMKGAVLAAGPLSSSELDTLFGPVALFPDEVLTPVLVAATFPLDVVKAARFVDEAQGLTDQERAAQAASQPWDDSVRTLAGGFPEVVKRMSDNIDWTEQAGEAVFAQTDAVLQAIQRLRLKAQGNGYLVDNDVQAIESVNDKIIISSAEPNVVYVPTYDSTVVYTTPLVGPPVYQYGYDYGDENWNDWGDAIVAGGIVLGGAVVLDEIFDDDDWDGWDSDDDIDWDGGDITIDRNDVDIAVDRGDRGDVTIGDRDQRIGDGDRSSIGESDRVQVDRGERTLAGDRGNGGEPLRASAGAGGVSISNTASREAARQKIETRSKAGVQPARLEPARQDAPRASTSGSRTSTPDRPTTRAAQDQRSSADRSPQVSRPTASRPPTARSPSRSTAFQKPKGGPRASAASERGHSSRGRPSGGGRSGGARRG